MTYSIRNFAKKPEIDSQLTIRAQVGAMAYIQQMRSDESYPPRLAIAPTTLGFFAMGIFLFFGAVMAWLAAMTLLWRGTALDHLWALNPTAYKQLASVGRTVGILFLALSVTLITAGIGWFRRRLWGWTLAIAITATQVLGDVVNCVRGDWLRGGTGVVIAGGLLVFLLRPSARRLFAGIRQQSNRGQGFFGFLDSTYRPKK